MIFHWLVWPQYTFPFFFPPHFSIFPKQIDAHLGNVYDIAFSHQNEALYVITCGEDKTVKVIALLWNFLQCWWAVITKTFEFLQMWKAVRTGSKISPVRTFVGHEAPVYSVCPFGKDPKVFDCLILHSFMPFFPPAFYHLFFVDRLLILFSFPFFLPKYIFSVDTNGKILAWIDGYALFTYDATPSWGRMACSANGRYYVL